MENDPATTTAPAPESSGKKTRGLPAGVIAGVLFAAAVLAGFVFLASHRSGPAPPAPPSQEAIAYADHLAVVDLHLSAEGNFLGQQVVYLDGKLTNRGDKTLRQLKVRLYFRDTLNQVVLREDQEVVKASSAPLAPGEAREFRLLFDRIPDSWNRQVPQFQLVSLEIQ